MRAVNCPSFRLACKRHGAGLVSTQTFWSWEVDKWKNRLGTEFSKQDAPLSIQVGGNRPDELVQTVRLLEEHADIIDFNAGSPHGEPCSHKSGAFLLLHVDQLERAVKAIIAATSKPVTVKLRTGWDSARVNVVQTVKMLCDVGVSAITVHGRTRQQLFKGRADWNQIKAAKNASSVPVIGNGDVKSGSDVEAVQRETGCDAVMIGRAAIGNPAIFKKVTEWLWTGQQLPWTFEDQQDDFRRFAESYHEIEKDRSTSEFKDHALWFLKGFKGVGTLKDKMRTLSSIDDIQQAFISFAPDAHRG